MCIVHGFVVVIIIIIKMFSVSDDDGKHDYITVFPDGGESQPLPTWKTYRKFLFLLTFNSSSSCCLWYVG